MHLWPNLDAARERTLYGLAHSDILKISDNEFIWLTGEENFDAGIRWVWKQFPQIRLVLLSLGPDDSWAYSGEAFAQVPCFRVIAIETTGAGDTFFGGMLHHVPQWGLRDYTEAELRQMLTFANAAAAIITPKKAP